MISASKPVCLNLKKEFRVGNLTISRAYFSMGFVCWPANLPLKVMKNFPFFKGNSSGIEPLGTGLVFLYFLKAKKEIGMIKMTQIKINNLFTILLYNLN